MHVSRRRRACCRRPAASWRRSRAGRLVGTRRRARRGAAASADAARARRSAAFSITFACGRQADDHERCAIGRRAGWPAPDDVIMPARVMALGRERVPLTIESSRRGRPDGSNRSPTRRSIRGWSRSCLRPARIGQGGDADAKSKVQTAIRVGIPGSARCCRNSPRSARARLGCACAGSAHWTAAALGLDLVDGVDHGVEGQQGRGMARLVVAHRLEHRDVGPAAVRRRACRSP